MSRHGKACQDTLVSETKGKHQKQHLLLLGPVFSRYNQIAQIPSAARPNRTRAFAAEPNRADGRKGRASFSRNGLRQPIRSAGVASATLGRRAERERAFSSFGAWLGVWRLELGVCPGL